MEVPSGSVVDFRTRDLWDHPDPGLTQPWDGEDGAFAPIPDADLNFDKAYGDLAAVHIITGPVGVAGAMPGDKLAIEILDITPLAQGFTMSDTPLGFMNVRPLPLCPPPLVRACIEIFVRLRKTANDVVN